MYSDIRSDEVRLLIHRVVKASRVDEYGIVEMGSMFFEFTLNNMMRMIARKRYYDDDEQNMEEAARFQEMIKETIEITGWMNVADFVPKLKWIMQNKVERKMKALKVKRDRFFQDLIEERRKIMRDRSGGYENEKKTLIDVLLSLQESEPDYYTDEIIKGMIEVT
ncbi:hypothetical protein ACH5RR_001789 [Cinchona calisaya]|uniref:Cytochrome P450 n=1 Tax=Cinchona calisaya TaxID=153742 RepID=A0ABD3B516_9GENT